MKLLITDDEPLARKRMRRLLEEYSSSIELFEASHGQEAIDLARQVHPDILCIDIEMPGISGLEAAKTIRQCLPNTSIIFITAYEQYALDAFDVLASGYLLKPVSRDKLHQVLDKVIAQSSHQPSALESAEPFLTSKVGTRVTKIPMSHINYIMAENKYVSAYHGVESSLIDDSLKHIEDQYSHIFTRIHRHTLVATARIMRVEKKGNQTFVFLSGLSHGLEISRRHIKAVKQVLQKHD